MGRGPPSLRLFPSLSLPLRAQVRANHFQPPGLGYPLTLLYPVLVAGDDPERNDERLVPLRQRLHALLGLPPNRPLLRSANAVDPGAAAAGGEEGGSGPVARLRDVHVGLAAPGEGRCESDCLVTGTVFAVRCGAVRWGLMRPMAVVRNASARRAGPWWGSCAVCVGAGGVMGNNRDAAQAVMAGNWGLVGGFISS